jgi:hypothetical protein
LQMHQDLWEHQVHTQLPSDLVEHMWAHNKNQRANIWIVHFK